MAVSTIISNFNGAKYLPRLLETLEAQQGTEQEIIIVDRLSTDDSHAILAAHPNVRVVSEPPESGLVAGYAVGADHARHEHLFFCNEDMWFEPGCLAELERSLDVASRVWAADPWQWTYDGAKWIHGGTRFIKSRKLLPCSPHPFRDFDFCAPLQRGEFTPFGCAGAIMMDRGVYREIGGWDKDFFLDREDLDIFMRAWRAKWKCVCVPEAKVYHAVNVSNAKSIKGGKLKVGKRRYISGTSSQLIMSAKYFPASWILFHFVVYLFWSFYHLCRFRTQQFAWEMLALRECFHRLPAALHYRAATRSLLKSHPGQKFFTEPSFQAGSRL